MQRVQRVLSGLIFASLVLVVLLPGLKATTTENAEVPWETGDEWALGLEIDLYEELKDELQLAEDELEGENGIRNLEWDLKGVTGYYQKGKVVDFESADYYRVESEAAYYLHSLIDFSVEVELPKPDRYEHVDDDDLVDLQWRDLAYQQTSDFVLRAKTISLYTADTWELEQVELTVIMASESSQELTNMPNFVYGDEEYDPACDCYVYEYIDVSYLDVEQSSSGMVNGGLTALFEPALNVFDFPIAASHNWYDTANVTLSGYFSGELDLSKPQGLTSDQMSEFYAAVNELLDDFELDYQVNAWSDLFPMQLPSAWMLPSDSAEQDEELAMLFENLTIDGDRFVFGPVNLGEFNYHFATGEMAPVETPGGVEVYAVPYTLEEMDELDSRSHGDDDYGSDEPTTYISTASGRPVKYSTTIPDMESGSRTIEVAPVTPAEATRQMEAKASLSDPGKGGYTPEEPPGVLSWLVLLMVLSVALAGGGAYAYRRRSAGVGPGPGPALEPVVQQPLQQSYYQTPATAASQYGYQAPQTDPHAYYRNPSSQGPTQVSPYNQSYAPQPAIGACPSCGGSYQITDYHSVLACPHCSFHIPAVA